MYNIHINNTNFHANELVMVPWRSSPDDPFGYCLVRAATMPGTPLRCVLLLSKAQITKGFSGSASARLFEWRYSHYKLYAHVLGLYI